MNQQTREKMMEAADLIGGVGFKTGLFSSKGASVAKAEVSHILSNGCFIVFDLYVGELTALEHVELVSAEPRLFSPLIYEAIDLAKHVSRLERIAIARDGDKRTFFLEIPIEDFDMDRDQEVGILSLKLEPAHFNPSVVKDPTAPFGKYERKDLVAVVISRPRNAVVLEVANMMIGGLAVDELAGIWTYNKQTFRIGEYRMSVDQKDFCGVMGVYSRLDVDQQTNMINDTHEVLCHFIN